MAPRLFGKRTEIGCPLPPQAASAMWCGSWLLQAALHSSLGMPVRPSLLGGTCMRQCGSVTPLTVRAVRLSLTVQAARLTSPISVCSAAASRLPLRQGVTESWWLAPATGTLTLNRAMCVYRLPLNARESQFDKHSKMREGVLVHDLSTRTRTRQLPPLLANLDPHSLPAAAGCISLIVKLLSALFVFVHFCDGNVQVSYAR